MFHRLAPLTILAIILGVAPLPLTMADSETGTINTLFIGDPFIQPGFPTPALIEDPKISLTRVVGELAFITKQEMTKAMRIYLPRTEEHLTQRYDLITLAAIRSDHLSPAFEKWIGEGVLDGKLSLLMSDDPVSFGCVDAWEGSGSPGWMETPVGQVLPVDDKNRINYEDIWFRFKPTEEFADHPFNLGIPWEQIKVNTHNRPTPRPGSRVLMRTSDESGIISGDLAEDSPVVIYWDIEKGRSMALIFDWGGNGVTDFYRWEYWRDVVARWFYLPVDAEIPTDTVITHSIRLMITNYALQKSVTISMLEFADMMGANVADVENELGDVNEERQEADLMWIRGEFEECRAKMEELITELEAVSLHAIEAKDSALLWIYISEWAVVTGTLCATGGIIWTLIIRRAMYREVRTTRSSNL